MKLIERPNLSYQSALMHFNRWIEDVRITDNVMRQDGKIFYAEANSFYFGKAHPFGDFGISFCSISEDSYLTGSGTVISFFSADCNTKKWDSIYQLFEKNTQWIQVIIESGYLLPQEDPDHCPRVFVSHKLCEVAYLFNQNKIAKSLKINGIEYENFSDINPNIVCPAVSTFFTFIANVIEGDQDYKKLKYNHFYTQVWGRSKLCPDSA